MHWDEFGREQRRYWGSSAPDPQPTISRTAETKKAESDAAQEAIRRKQTQTGYKRTILTNDFMAPDTQAKLATLGS